MNLAYYPKANSIEYPQIKVFIPYTNIHPETAIALIGYDYKPVKTLGEYGYLEYFLNRWKEGQKFISIEHDVVPYPGALEALWDCPKDLCGYSYHLPNHRIETKPNLPIGCIKVSANFIKNNKNLWDKAMPWDQLDQHLMVNAHQHFPGVVNANTALLGFAKEENGNN